MSGIQMMMLGSGGGFQVISGATFSSSTTATGAGSSTAQVVYQVDGTTSIRGGGPAYTYTTGQWGSPTPTANIGLSYWMSVDAAAWVQINGVNISQTGGNSGPTTYTVRIASDSAGVNTVATQTVSLTTANGL